MNRPLILLVALLSVAVFACRGVLATSAREISPLPKGSVVSIGITIGGGLELDGEPDDVLFGTDLERADAFQEVLEKKVRERLSACEISVSEDSLRHLHFRFFGRSIPELPSHDFFLVEVSVTDTEGEPGTSSGLLGTSPDTDLEQALLKLALSQIDDWLCRE